MNRLIVFAPCIVLFYYGCYVGARVHIKSDHLKYPVSYTSSFYSSDFKLIESDEYRKITHFDFSFTKWGISDPLNISSEEDISEKLNQLIKENNGNAVVNLVVSINSAPINDALMVPKSLAFVVGLVGIPLFISEPTGDNAALALGAIAVYLFTPGAATVKIEGDVVKILGNVKG